MARQKKKLKRRLCTKGKKYVDEYNKLTYEKKTRKKI